MDDKQQSQPHDIMWLYLQRQNNKNFDVVEAVSTIINELTCRIWNYGKRE